jgi:hypothetical protein
MQVRQGLWASWGGLYSIKEALYLGKEGTPIANGLSKSEGGLRIDATSLHPSTSRAPVQLLLLSPPSTMDHPSAGL